MVRAGAVGTHLPASGWDIFGDLRKMNKRQVREARGVGAPGARTGCDGGESGLSGQGSGKDSDWGSRRPQAPPPALRGRGFKSAQTHVWARVCAVLH